MKQTQKTPQREIEKAKRLLKDYKKGVNKMSEKFTKWEEFEKELNITPEQELEIQLEMDIIRATIEARKKNNLTQRELSEKSGVKQPAIARIEKGINSPRN